MTVHPAIARLRAADRAPAESNTNDDLYRRIVATPGDPRLGPDRPPSAGARWCSRSSPER